MMQESAKDEFRVTAKGKILVKLSAQRVAEESQKYVDDRRKGLIKSLSTKFKRLDSYLMGGIEGNTIMCISALSGAGKSTIAKVLRDSIWELNQDQGFCQYLFNFEMVAFQQASRSIVTAADIPLKKLYSVGEEEDRLTDDEYEKLKPYYEALKQRKDVWFIETPGTAQEIAHSLLMYYKEECRPYGKTLVYEIDHALLTKGFQGEKEKERIDDLMYRLVELKKVIATDGGTSIGIVMSQMNRDIRKPERIKDKQLHRPTTSDLFGASSIEQCCDYIIFLHMPAKLAIPSYTLKDLPTRVTIGKQVYMIPYLELVKQRSGDSDLTIPLWNLLHRFNFDEMDINTFKTLHQQFKDTGSCTYDKQQQFNF